MTGTHDTASTHSGAPARHGHNGHGDHAHLVSALDLDAELMGGYLDDAAALIADTLGRTPGTIVDLGAGTGTGTQALARRFPEARIVAVDSSPEMGELVSRRAENAGFADRLDTVVADLDAGLPELGSPDVVWAAMSLHHVADPVGLLRAIAASLAEDGVVAIAEMADVPRFSSAREDPELQDLQDRCQAATAHAGWEALVDWTDALDDAGYDVLRHQTIEIERGGPSQSVARYARHWFSQFRHRLTHSSADPHPSALSPADVSALDDLLDEDNPTALHRRDDLTMRAGRLVWIARPRGAVS
ncbi:class I SAM-dependent methyltransferase [Gordonia terrae]|uniref:class I SAM-dependent methyltransferase n=1 Tax=Gordonia terrae TaxID=2055 RepID=UPI003F6C60D9